MTSRDTLFAILILVVAGIMFFLFFQGKIQSQDDQAQGQFCAQDIRFCPDGSYVSRVAPSCDFAECPSTSDGIIPGAGGTVQFF